MKYRDLILYGIILAMLAIILGEVMRVGLRVERVYDELDEVEMLMGRIAMKPCVGEAVK